MVRLNRFYAKRGDSKFWAVVSLMGFAVGMLALMGLIVELLSLVGWLGSRGGNHYERENTAFHALPAEPYIPRDSLKNTVIEDNSPYAEDESLSLYRYASRFYQDQRLTQEAEYDAQGGRTLLHTLKYDTAGNVLTEQIADETGAAQAYRHIYEYDDLGRMVHEEIYRDEDLMERHYFRYLYSSYEYGGSDNAFNRDIGYAGVSYSYLNDQIDGGISNYCASRTEFLTDGEDNPLCIIKLNSLNQDTPGEVWKLQWQKQGDRLLNRVQYYKNSWEKHYNDTDDWYLHTEHADEEQFNLYECSEMAGKRLVLQLNYNNKSRYLLKNSFYRARYDGDRLLWQMDYLEGRLVYYSACLYDEEGRLQEAVEYDVQGEEEPLALFHRYEYPEPDREEQYIYVIQGEEFSQELGENSAVKLVFSADGILSSLKMTNMSENGSEIYEFAASGENTGQLKQMCRGTDVTEGERAVLKKLEREAKRLGFHVGEDLESNTEGSVE